MSTSISQLTMISAIISRTRRLLIGTLACFALSGGAIAADSDYTDFGWYTYDSSTGLYWLDVTETTHETWLDVYNQMGPGDRYEGWRFATDDEIEYMWVNIGLWPQNNFCQYTGALFCDSWNDSTTMRFNVNKVIDLFGDTFDAYYVRSHNYDYGDYPRGFFGMLEEDDAYIADPDTFVTRAYLIEYDSSRRLQSRASRESTDDHHAAHGHFLVRDTLPVALSPLPDATPPGAIDFDNVMPDDLGLQFACQGRAPGITPYTNDSFSGYCSGHLLFIDRDLHTAEVRLGLPGTFDRQATPFIRLKSFDFRDFDIYDNQQECTPDGFGSGVLYIEDAEGKHYLETDIIDLQPAPQGGDWCRVTLDTEYQFLPLLSADPDFPGLVTPIKIGAESYNDCCGNAIGLDNIVVELFEQNIVVDFDPWDASNEFRPDEDYFFTVAVMTTSVADGDLYDFDASTVDAASLRLGPNGAQNTAAPIVQDRDGDGDIDYTFAFEMTDSGLTCIDTSVTLSGKDLSGNPIAGMDIIVPVDCDDIITVDVDPFNPANEVRPNDDYTVPVAILSTQVSNGEAEDIDATQIDPATLKFGPAETPNVGTPVVTDLDGDTDNDVIFGFNAFDSGIACGDTELEVTGELYDTQPLIGMDSISTVDCGTSECHP